MGSAREVYLDYNATVPVRPEVSTAVRKGLNQIGNPSSVHTFGRSTRTLVESARKSVADLVQVEPAQVIFTSGGTEANNLALSGSQRTMGCTEVVVSAVEHPSVLESEPSPNVIPVDENGIIKLSELEVILGSVNPPALISVMLANNETGVLQPINDVVRMARNHKAFVHCDAVQALGKMPLAFDELGADFVSISGHKIGGLQGAGALICAEGIEIDPILVGGGQERNKRSGTENVIGIIAFGSAAATVRSNDDEIKKMSCLTSQLESEIRSRVPKACVYGSTVGRLPNTSCIGVDLVKSEDQLICLDLAGVAVSAGSACSSGKIAPSHVLLAMGCTEEAARSAIRVSIGYKTTQEDINRFIEVWTRLVFSQTGDSRGTAA